MGRSDPHRARGRPVVRVLVFAGGDLPARDDLPEPLDADLVVAADSGLDHARALGMRVDLVVGDLDSVDPVNLEAAIADGVEVERHPAAKDATDLELALDAAVARGATSVSVVGAHGGRLDHFLANVLLLASPRYGAVHVEARMPGVQVVVVRDRVELVASPGALCSLLPVGGAVTGIETDGLRFPLRYETLEPSSTRGVSNELLRSRAAVSIETGVLVAVITDPQDTDPQDTDLRTPDSRKDA